MVVSGRDVTAALTSVQHMKGDRKLGGHCKGFRWVGGWGRSATTDPVESECWEEGVSHKALHEGVKGVYTEGAGGFTADSSRHPPACEGGEKIQFSLGKQIWKITNLYNTDQNK